MAGPHQPERAATTDLPNQINNVCMYVCITSCCARYSTTHDLNRHLFLADYHADMLVVTRTKFINLLLRKVAKN